MSERVAEETPPRRAEKAPASEPAVGNVTRADPARSPVAVPVGKSTLPTPEQAAGDIRRRLQAASPPPTGELDEILTTLQLLHPRMAELKAAYKRAHGIDLVLDLQLRMPAHAFPRAELLIRHGTIRLADKLFLAVAGGGTDEGTLMRLLPSVRSDPKAEEEFAADYGHHYRRGKTRLPDGTHVDSAILSMLTEELEDWELDQALALYARGKLLPVDEIRIATNRYGTEETMLYAALEKGMEQAPGGTAEEKCKNLTAQFALAYPDAPALGVLLDDELSYGEFERAQLILEGRAAEGSVVLAIAGLGTDVSTIMKTIADADPGERQCLRNMFNAGRELADKPASRLSPEQRNAVRFYQDLKDDLDAVDLKQVEAVLAKNEQTDGATELLAQAGAGLRADESSRWWGSAQEDLVDAIRDAGDEELAVYRRALESDAAFKQRFEQLDEEQQSHVRIMLTGTLRQKLYLATGTWKDMRAGTDEEYIFDAVRKATDAEKREIAGDDELMGSLRLFELGTTDYNKLLDLLRTPDSETLDERVSNTQAQVERERSGWTAGMNAEWALRDEAREMGVRHQLAKRDGSVSAAERKRVLEAESGTLAALETYKQARDEVEEIAAQVITTAAGMIVTIATFGAGAIAVTALNVAKAAAAMAVTRVLATKVAHGDRFDIFGTDGATAFAAGAIEGAAGVLAAVPAGAAAKGLLPAAQAAVTETAESTFRYAGRELLKAALEGGISAAPGAVFETTVQATEMRGRIEDKLTHVGLGSVNAVVTSAVTSTAMQAAAMGVGALLPDGDAPDVTTAPEDAGASSAPVTEPAAGEPQAPVTEAPVADTPAPVTDAPMADTPAPVTDAPMAETPAPVTAAPAPAEVKRTTGPAKVRPDIDIVRPGPARPSRPPKPPKSRKPAKAGNKTPKPAKPGTADKTQPTAKGKLTEREQMMLDRQEAVAGLEQAIAAKQAKMVEAAAEKTALAREYLAMQQELDARARAAFGPLPADQVDLRRKAEYLALRETDPEFRALHDKFGDAIQKYKEHAGGAGHWGALQDLKRQRLKTKTHEEIYRELRRNSKDYPDYKEKRAQAKRHNPDGSPALDELGSPVLGDDEIEVDHLHPLSVLVWMDGFVLIKDPKARARIAHSKKNLALILGSTNTKRSNTPWEAWTGYTSFKPDAARAAQFELPKLRQRERDAIEWIEAQIKEELAKQGGL